MSGDELEIYCYICIKFSEYFYLEELKVSRN